MTHADFINAIEAYYGEYRNATVNGVVLSYVMNNYRESELENLLERVIANYSNQYKTPPDVAAIRKLTVPDTRAMEAEARHEFKRIVDSVNIYRDLIVDNVAAQEALIDCGGYVALCNTDVDKLPFVETRFIKSYCYYRESPPDVERKVLRGIADESEPILISSSVPQLSNKNIAQLENKANKEFSKLVNDLTRKMLEE